jgi:radical SAM superfamily enzyme YgiQ (UPF0313 family)
MHASLYLVNPRSDSPTYYSAEAYEAWGLRPTAFVADLALVSLAAMAPSDFTVTLCDENLDAVNFDTPAEFVGITGKISQSGRMLAIADRFRRQGKVVLIGGPCASLSPELFREHCDILVQGECEEIFTELCADLRSGRWRREYEGGKPDLGLAPLPRWDLYPNDRALQGAVQTSRGCPYECEFCDVIQYLGRKQRHKPIANVLRELDVLYRHGYRTAFLADDNLTVFRARAKELLKALEAWNGRQADGAMNFTTQVSIDVAKDDEMLRLLANSGVTTVFVGIETPNEESHREVKKRQNLRLNLVDEVTRIVEHGIMVNGGMIVGFDADGPDIFERQLAFASAMPVPIFSVGALVAPAATPLHERMRVAGRLVRQGTEVAATPWTTNIMPSKLTREQLVGGLRWLCNRLYQPTAFGERVRRFFETFGRTHRGSSRPPQRAELSPLQRDTVALISRVWSLGHDEQAMLSAISSLGRTNPSAVPFATHLIVQYAQVRHMYQSGNFWDHIPSVAPVHGTESLIAPTSLRRGSAST